MHFHLEAVQQAAAFSFAAKGRLAVVEVRKPLTDDRLVWRAGRQERVTVGHDAIKSTGTARGTAARI
jgi:hypothetical protein